MKKRTKLLVADKMIVFYFILLSFQYVIEYYLNIGNILANIIFRFMTLVILLIPILLILLDYNPLHNTYRIFFVLIFLLNILVTVIYFILGYGKNISNFLIYYSMIIAFYLNKIDIDIIYDTIKKIAIIGCISLPLIFLFNRIDLAVALRRGYTWTNIFYFTSFYWAVIPFVIMSFIKRKNLVLSILYWIASLILYLLFIKRAIIVDTTLLLITILLISIIKGKSKSLLIITSLLILTCLSLLFFDSTLYTLFKEVIKRFSDVDIVSVDRAVETVNYFKSINVIDIIFGKGYLSKHFGLGKESYALHIGWSNFVFKGGIFLLLIIITPYIKLITLFRRIKDLPEKIQFSLFMMLVYFIKLCYSNLHSFLPEGVMFIYCLFNIMDYKKSNYESSKILRKDINNAAYYSIR